jgi:hypothetical protein
MDIYEYLFSKRIIQIGDESVTDSLTFMVMKNGGSISFQKSLVDLSDNNLPDYISFEHTVNSNSTIHTLTFEYAVNKSISMNSFELFIKTVSDGIFNLNEGISIKDISNIQQLNFKFDPSTITIPVDSNGVNQNLNGRAAILKLYEGDTQVNLDASDVIINTSSGYIISSIENQDLNVIVKIYSAVDGILISAAYVPDSTKTATLQVLHQSAITPTHEFVLTPETLVYNVTSLGVPKAGSEDYKTSLYLRNSLGDFIDINVTDVLIGNPAGIVLDVTQQTNSNGVKYIRLIINEWTTEKAVHSIEITINNNLYSPPPIVLGLVKTADGAIGDSADIDAQGSGVPTGAGMINEDAGYKYLDTDDSKLYFKIGASGVDTWTDGVVYSKGDKGDTGPAPAHNVNGTLLSFQNPDGTWGTEFDTKGIKGDTGDIVLPHAVDVDPATGRLTFYYMDNGSEVTITTTNSAIAPPAPPLEPEKGDPGASINWLGNLNIAPTNPAVNDAYRNVVDKKSYIWTQSGTWDILAEDGAPAESLLKSVATKADLEDLVYSSSDIGHSVYIIDEQIEAIVHAVNTSGIATYRYSTPLSST